MPPFCIFSLLSLLAGRFGLGPSLDPLLCPIDDDGLPWPGPAVGLGGGGREPMDIVLTFEGGALRPGAPVLVAKVVDRCLLAWWRVGDDLTPTGPDMVGLCVSSLLLLAGLGDLAGRGDLVAEFGLERAGLVEVAVLRTGFLAGCGCQPVFRVMVGGDCARFTGGFGFGLSANKESVLLDLLRDDLFIGGDFFTGCTLEADVSLLFAGGEGFFLVADSFLSSFSLEGRAGTTGDFGVGVLAFLSR